MDKAKGYLGLARKAGRLAVGEESCGAAAAQGRAKLFLLSSDASPHTAKRAASFLRGHRAPLATLPWTRSELGSMLGGGGYAMLCFTDLPLAARFSAAMAEELPSWEETSELLSRREDKAARRKAAPRKHERGGT